MQKYFVQAKLSGVLKFWTGGRWHEEYPEAYLYEKKSHATSAAKEQSIGVPDALVQVIRHDPSGNDYPILLYSCGKPAY